VVLLLVAGLMVARVTDADDAVAEAAAALDSDDAVTVSFPPAPSGASVQPEEPRFRPVGIRVLEVGVEGQVVGVTDLPSCRSEVRPLDRIRWFDPSAMGSGTAGGVAPGEHGVALLVAGSASLSAAELVAGIERVRVGEHIEVARTNGTVLGWSVVAVVDLPAGSSFPARLLEGADEQRLVLLSCGVAIDEVEVDRFVLARRSP